MGMYVYLKLIHVVVCQKPTQHCKVVIFQLKNYASTKKREIASVCMASGLNSNYVYHYILQVLKCYTVVKSNYVTIVVENT